MPLRPIVVMGPAGCGKSTIGGMLAERYEVDFIDADDLHPDVNKAKMAAGTPLDDADRWPWLRLVGKAMSTEIGLGRGVVVACSALKRSYRDALREAAPGAIFVYLDGSRELLTKRIGARTGHFMPSALLDSQLAALERLADDEVGVVVDIDASPEAIVEAALAALTQIE